MKKRILILLISGILLPFLLTSCSHNCKSLTDHGLDVISLMAEMVENEDFRALYNLPAAYEKTIEKQF